jgi:hypothetical protein
VKRCLKAGIVELEETFIARQFLAKHVTAATNTEAALEVLLGAMVITEES